MPASTDDTALEDPIAPAPIMATLPTPTPVLGVGSKAPPPRVPPLAPPVSAPIMRVRRGPTQRATPQWPTPWWQAEVASLPATVWLKTLQKIVNRHLRLPKSAKTGQAGSQHPKFSIPNSPLVLVRARCLEAGLVEKPPVLKRKKRTYIFKGVGPSTAYNFCHAQHNKSLGQGSAALVAPREGFSVSSGMTMAIPPITVKHVETDGEWWTTVDLYLGVYNDSNLFTLPLDSNTIYKDQLDPTELFKRAALKVLGQMYMRGFPLSLNFKELLGPDYSSEAGEMTEESSEEESSGEESSSEEGEEEEASS